MAKTPRSTSPVAGNWYEDTVGRRFEVASVDTEAGIIQVVYDDGEAAQMDFADWRHVMVEHDALPDELIEPPPDDHEP